MTAMQLELLLLVGLVLVASVAGVLALYTHTIMPGLKKLDDQTFVQSFKAIDRRIINGIFMTQFFAPVFVVGAAAVYAFAMQIAIAPLVSGAFACYLGVVAITIGVNVPLNDGIKRVADVLTPGEAAKARAQFNEQKWATYNMLRTVLSVVAGGLLVAAIAM